MGSSYNPLSGIDWGTEVSGHTIDVYFAPDGVKAGGLGDSEGFNNYEIKRFKAAFDAFEQVANLHFNIVHSKSAADFVLLLQTDKDMKKGTLGMMIPPGERHGGVGEFNGKEWDRHPGGDLRAGGYGFITIVHELLHGLGFAHPHDKGGSSTKFPGVSASFDDYGPKLLNQGIFTIMTYNAGFNKGPTGFSAFDHGFHTHGYEAGPMALDIALLQQKYGANTSYHHGDNVYDLPDGNHPGAKYLAIWDTGGTDVLRYEGSRNTTIDLRPATLNYERGGGGYVSGAKGVAGGFTIANGVEIENAHSDRGNDKLIGNNAANRLVSGAGKDKLVGHDGNDHLLAGSGNDRANGGSGNDTIKGEAGADRISGQDGSDTLIGGGGSDRAGGGSGNDTIKGGVGADKILGGGGDDTLIGGGGGDRIEAGAGNDHLNGGGGNDVLKGGGGDDEFHSGQGSDQLTGGAGADAFDFTKGTGRDTVTDLLIGIDTLSFDPHLWGGGAKTASEIVDMAEVTGFGIVWHFSSGDTVRLEGLFDTSGLEASIVV